MPAENVEVVRAAFAAWNRGDYEAWLELWSEEAELYPLRAQLEGEAYRGHDGLRRFIVDTTEEWEECASRWMTFAIPETRSWDPAASGRAAERAGPSSTSPSVGVVR
jgi:ketosteroid isomerase-like protein